MKQAKISHLKTTDRMKRSKIKFSCPLLVGLCTHTSARQVTDGEVITWDAVVLSTRSKQATEQYLVPQRVMFLYLCYYQHKPLRSSQSCRLWHLSCERYSVTCCQIITHREVQLWWSGSTTTTRRSSTAKIPVIFNTCKTSFVCNGTRDSSDV